MIDLLESALQEGQQEKQYGDVNRMPDGVGRQANRQDGGQGSALHQDGPHGVEHQVEDDRNHPLRQQDARQLYIPLVEGQPVDQPGQRRGERIPRKYGPVGRITNTTMSASAAIMIAGDGPETGIHRDRRPNVILELGLR